MNQLTLRGLFETYARAFGARDVDAISRHWMLPAVITSPERTKVFTEREAFYQNTGGVLAFYAKQGVAAVSLNALDVIDIHKSVALAAPTFTLERADGRASATWRHHYIVRETVEGPRIAIADAERAAWAAQGTPLGGRT